MAMSNAERQRRFRQNRKIKVETANAGRADLSAVYEALRRQWLLGNTSGIGPNELRYRERLAAMPAATRQATERLGFIADTLIDAVGSIIERAHGQEIQAKRRLDRQQ